MSHSSRTDGLLLPGLPGCRPLQAQGAVLARERQTWRPAAEEREKTMSLYPRGGVWWYHFRFAGQHIQESTKSKSKTVARDAERSRRRQLEESWNQIRRRQLPPL